MNLRVMKVEDLEKVSQLEEQCFSDPWNMAMLSSELLENPFSNGWIMEEGDEIIGYAFMWITFERAEISDIAIAPNWQSQGYGRKLMKALMRSATRSGCEFMNLEVRASNRPARSLYKSLGFLPVRMVRRYYDDGEDGIMMSAALQYENGE